MSLVKAQKERICDMCRKDRAIKGYKFCKDCKKVIVKELEESGYLTPKVPPRQYTRTADMKELTHETKFGKSQG